MIVKFLEITFSRHDTCKLLCDTSLALARSSPTRRYTGNITDVAERVHHELIGEIPRSSLPWFRLTVEFSLSSCAPAVPQALDHAVWIQCSLHTTKD